MARILSLALALSIFLAAPANAHETAVLVSAPFLLGVDRHTTLDSSTNLAIGERPEVILARVSHGGGWGLGPWGDLVRAHQQEWLGGGLTAVRYFPTAGGLALALSGGVEQRTERHAHVRTTPVFGAFFGTRTVKRWEDSSGGFPFDLPFGARVDVRPGSQDIPTSVDVQLQVDLAGAMAFILYFAGHPSFGH